MSGLVGPSGRPIAHDGPTGRKIIIHEAMVQGRPAWGVDFEGIGILEVFQILGDVIRGIAQRERSLIAEKRAMAKVQEKVNQINEENKK